jgi:hypothetical protein
MEYSILPHAERSIRVGMHVLKYHKCRYVRCETHYWVCSFYCSVLLARLAGGPSMVLEINLLHSLQAAEGWVYCIIGSSFCMYAPNSHLDRYGEDRSSKCKSDPRRNVAEMIKRAPALH